MKDGPIGKCLRQAETEEGRERTSYLSSDNGAFRARMRMLNEEVDCPCALCGCGLLDGASFVFGTPGKHQEQDTGHEA
jgi:hypothetical protein